MPPPTLFPATIVELTVRKKGYNITELARLAAVDRRTVYNWFNQKYLKTEMLVSKTTNRKVYIITDITNNSNHIRINLNDYVSYSNGSYKHIDVANRY